MDPEWMKNPLGKLSSITFSPNVRVDTGYSGASKDITISTLTLKETVGVPWHCPLEFFSRSQRFHRRIWNRRNVAHAGVNVKVSGVRVQATVRADHALLESMLGEKTRLVGGQQSKAASERRKTNRKGSPP